MRTERPENDFSRYLKPVYYLIYELGITTGLRISDIIDIKKKVLMLTRPTIKQKKTGKSKTIYIRKDLKKQLEVWCQRDEFARNSDYIFASEKSMSGHITRQAVWNAFKIASKRASIKHNIGTHSMRKIYAKAKFKANKGNIQAVQKLLQHEAFADTLIYLIGDD